MADHRLSPNSPCLKTLNTHVDAVIKDLQIDHAKNGALTNLGQDLVILFDSVAQGARKGETGEDRLGQNLFSQQKPNFGDTLANYQHKEDTEIGVDLFGKQLKSVGSLLEADRNNLDKKMGKDAAVKSLYETLGKINDERGKPLREYIVASLNLGQRAMGLGRTLTEVFERKGNEKTDELAKKLQVVALKVLHNLGERLLQVNLSQSEQIQAREHVFHATMKIAADCYSHIALAVRYEAHYKMTNGEQTLLSLQKSFDLLKMGHEFCGLSMRYRAFAETPARMTSSMNGFVQNTEFLYTLDALASRVLSQTRVFSEVETLGYRTELWRMCGGTRWACVDAWGLLDTSRRLPNIFLRTAILDQKTDKQIKKVWTDGMRIRQLLLGLLLRPAGDVGYNRYPGFLAPITLAEILHDIAEAEAMVEESHAELKLRFWGEHDAATMCDIVRDHFAVHGEVGNFFEVKGDNMIKRASAETRAEFKRELMMDQSEDDFLDTLVLPSVPENKFLSLSWAVVLQDGSPYLPVLKRLASALRKTTSKEHTLWKPGEDVATALSLDDPKNAPAQELVRLVGYRCPSEMNYVTKVVDGSWVEKDGIGTVGMWRQEICDDAVGKICLEASPGLSVAESGRKLLLDISAFSGGRQLLVDVTTLAEAVRDNSCISLFLCILVDLIGFASYALFMLGEVTDLWWAPIFAFFLHFMFGSRLVSSIGCIEELLPFTDIIPTATIAWLITHVKWLGFMRAALGMRKSAQPQDASRGSGSKED